MNGREHDCPLQIPGTADPVLKFESDPSVPQRQWLWVAKVASVGKEKRTEIERIVLRWLVGLFVVARSGSQVTIISLAYSIPLTRYCTLDA